MSVLDRARQNSRNNLRPWSCPFCGFEGTVSDRAEHLTGHG